MQLHSATATPRDMRDLPLIPPMKIVFHDAIDFSAGNDNLIVPGDLEDRKLVQRKHVHRG